MPKYVVNAGGDQYFAPDSSKFYFGDLTGPKFLRYVPNADHSLRGSDAQDSILAFYPPSSPRRRCPSSPERWPPTVRSASKRTVSPAK
jgi:PhoPQ-activated pathogenicity-related protein